MHHSDDHANSDHAKGWTPQTVSLPDRSRCPLLAAIRRAGGRLAVTLSRRPVPEPAPGIRRDAFVVTLYAS
jgi:hypothetical protein